MKRSPRRDGADRPRVLVVADASPAKGGISSFAERLCEDAALAEGFGLELLNTTRRATWKGGAPSLLNIRRAVVDVVRVARAARRSSITHLQTALLPTLPLLRVALLSITAAASGSKVIVHAHTGLSNEATYESFRPSRPQRALLALLGRVSDLILMVACAGKKGLKPYVGHVRVEVLPNGINVDDYEAHPASEGEPIVVYAGALGVGKGLVDLLEAVQEIGLPPTRLLVVGGVNQRGAEDADSIRARFCDAGYGQSLKGEMGTIELRKVMRKAHIVVLPSHSEGHPLVLLEAMASARPVVATEVGGIPQTISHGVEGALVPPHDGHRLAGALEEMLSDPDMRRRMGRAARQRVETEFEWSLFRNRLMDLYESCLKKR